MKRTTRTNSRPCLCLLLLVACPLGLAFGQNKESLLNRLTRTEMPSITLETDFTTLIQNRKTNNYFPATMTTADGVVRKLEIKPRGKFRRKTCELPPLKFKFSKKALVAEGLDTMNEIKLVVPCFDSDAGDELIIREYLAYKMFEKLTPVHLRVALAKVTLKDTHVENDKKQFLALLVEDEEELNARLGCVKVDQYGVEPDSLNTNQAALTVLFNYFIGNTDWEIAMMRNIRLQRSINGGKVLTVPYDLDFSGFVNAPSATPNSESGARNVRERVIMASGLGPEVLRQACRTIKAKQAELLAVCHTKLLSRSAQEDLVDFLKEFFDGPDVPAAAPKSFKVQAPRD